jgi:hypothetical protein
MRIARIVNAVPQNHSNETNNDSEPNIAVNPANPLQMAITAFTPPDAGLINGPIYYSTDGGENWSLLFNVPGNGSRDQTIGFASSSNELFMATLRNDTSPITLNVDRTSDPTSGAFPSIETRTTLDQPWVHAITVPSGPNAGKVCTYVGYGDQTSGYWATVDVCFDALAASPTFTKIKLNSRTALRDGFHIRPKPHSDGTVYVGYQSWQSQSGNNTTMNMVVARDDNWGNNSFGDLTDPSDSAAGRLVANVTIDESTPLGGQRPDNGFDVQVDPNDSDVVYLSWIDNGGSGFRLHVRRSLNRGKDWSGDLITVDNAALATMAINSQGTVALTYLQLVSNLWQTHFRTTSDGTTWDDLLLAQTATNGFIGDYMRMVAVGPHFYGVFPAVNSPIAGNFFPNGGGTVRFQRNNNGTALLGTDNTTVISSSTDPFFFKVEEKDATIILNRDPIGQDEVDARRLQPHGLLGGLPIQDAFRVVVDGFTAAELGLTGPASTLPMTSSLSSTVMPITCTGNTSDTGGYGPQVQRFTFDYSVDFDAADQAFSFGSATFDVTLTCTAGPVTSSALLTLIKQPDPFMLHGDPSWLSVDLRFVVARQNQAMFGVPGITGPDDAPRFIQQLIAAITPAQFDALPPGEEDTKLYTQPNDENNAPVFNFALAKVHYIGLIGASKVRVFFRLFQAQSTTSTYDYPPGAQYRRATMNPHGQPIPLAGILGPEYVTLPFFAEHRVDSTVVAMDQQTDDPYNVQDISAHADGSEVDKIFGCWLDINQPFKADGVTPNNVLPTLVPPSQDGPFDPNDPNPLFRPLPIGQAILRALHQCLIAEVAFDPAPIPLGKDTSNWDKLAQRNIAWSDVGSAQAGTTFEIRPTAAALPARQTPDELMIDWNNTPAGGVATIYLPAVRAADVLAFANRLYAIHKLAREDEHTIRCLTGGITYVPIPPGGPVNYAGLLTVDVNASGRRGETFNVVVRQVTNAFAEPPPPPPPPPRLEAQLEAVAPAQAAAKRAIAWRRVIGAFQLSIPVKNKEALLRREERDLSVLRWIAEAIPRKSRWYDVFHRYLKLVAGRVTSFNGTPGSIEPSPKGDGVPTHRRPHHARHPEHSVTGKIANLIFDHFGDFVGFVLETEHGERHFHSREGEILRLAERVWRERLRISVVVGGHDHDRIERLIIHRPPATFGQ